MITIKKSSRKILTYLLFSAGVILAFAFRFAIGDEHNVSRTEDKARKIFNASDNFLINTARADVPGGGGDPGCACSNGDAASDCDSCACP